MHFFSFCFFSFCESVCFSRASFAHFLTKTLETWHECSSGDVEQSLLLFFFNFPFWVSLELAIFRFFTSFFYFILGSHTNKIKDLISGTGDILETRIRELQSVLQLMVFVNFTASFGFFMKTIENKKKWYNIWANQQKIMI